MTADPDLMARARKVLADTPTIDFHSHLGLWETRGLDAPDPMAAYIGDDAIVAHTRKMMDAGCKAVSLNITSDLPLLKLGEKGNKVRDFLPGEAWAEYQRLWRNLNGLLEVAPMEIATKPQDVTRLHEMGKLAVFLSIEGAHMVEDDLDLIDQLRADGVTKFQPLHYVFSTLGDNQTDDEVHGGLSRAGKDAVRRAAEACMIIDAAHATEKATAHMAEAAGGPIVLSHTLMTYRDRAPDEPATRYARWISRGHARMIADTGGLIGTWAVNAPYGAGSAEDFVEAVLALTDEVGIDHVCWSTDHIDVGMGAWFRDYRDFENICVLLLEAGFSDADLAKFTAGNVHRLMCQIL